MPVFSKENIESWERFYRANFINSLTGFKPASLIGTINKESQTNLAIFSSIVHIGSNPSLVGFINRPLTAAPHTIDNILSTGVYTINHIHEGMLERAHQTSAKYPAGTSEFDETGLTADFHAGFDAPYVKESKVKYGLQFKQLIPITINDTFLVIGEIKEVDIAEGLLTVDGFLQLEHAGTISSNGTDSYYKTTPVARYAYAKAGILPKKIT
jgi:flavin reductase (DIM6/NTAB) family NADH-FMN oxidoreductase RutF